MLDNLEKKRKIVLIVIIVLLVILIVLIISSINLKNEDSDVTYTKENTLIVDGVNASTDENSNKTSSVEDDTSWNISTSEQEKLEYLSSNLTSEFISFDFVYVDVDKTSLKKYFNKLVGYYNTGDTKAMLANLDESYKKQNNINESNVKNIYRKNGITSDYKVEYAKFWGVNNEIYVVTLKNDLSGSSHNIGINVKLYENGEVFYIYPEEYFENVGFKIKDGNISKLKSDKELLSSFNNILSNEYNTIKFGE